MPLSNPRTAVIILPIRDVLCSYKKCIMKKREELKTYTPDSSCCLEALQAKTGFCLKKNLLPTQRVLGTGRLVLLFPMKPFGAPRRSSFPGPAVPDGCGCSVRPWHRSARRFASPWGPGWLQGGRYHELGGLCRAVCSGLRGRRGKHPFLKGLKVKGGPGQSVRGLEAE